MYFKHYAFYSLVHTIYRQIQHRHIGKKKNPQYTNILLDENLHSVIKQSNKNMPESLQHPAHSRTPESSNSQRLILHHQDIFWWASYTHHNLRSRTHCRTVRECTLISFISAYCLVHKAVLYFSTDYIMNAEIFLEWIWATESEHASNTWNCSTIILEDLKEQFGRKTKSNIHQFSTFSSLFYWRVKGILWVSENILTQELNKGWGKGQASWCNITSISPSIKITLHNTPKLTPLPNTVTSGGENAEHIFKMHDKRKYWN